MRRSLVFTLVKAWLALGTLAFACEEAIPVSIVLTPQDPEGVILQDEHGVFTPDDSPITLNGFGSRYQRLTAEDGQEYLDILQRNLPGLFGAIWVSELPAGREGESDTLCIHTNQLELVEADVSVPIYVLAYKPNQEEQYIPLQGTYPTRNPYDGLNRAVFMNFFITFGSLEEMPELLEIRGELLLGDADCSK